jgi:hypothetical protein
MRVIDISKWSYFSPQNFQRLSLLVFQRLSLRNATPHQSWYLAAYLKSRNGVITRRCRQLLVYGHNDVFYEHCEIHSTTRHSPTKFDRQWKFRDLQLFLPTVWRHMGRGGDWGTALLILSLGTRNRWAVNCSTQQLYVSERNPVGLPGSRQKGKIYYTCHDSETGKFWF